MSYSFNFSGKLAVVTGGLSGIGKATTNAFLACGAKVIVLDVGKGLANEFDNAENVSFVSMDVAEMDEVSEGEIQSIVQSSGSTGVDFLINNAGIEFNDCGNLIDMPLSKLKRIVDVNMYGYINCARAFVPHMSQGASVVNVSSIQGLAAHLPGTSYQVTKSAILGLTNALSVELASKGIRVNTVAPGAIATEGMGAVRSDETDVLDPYRRRIPLGRRGRADEVAGPILFLCSDHASYITGSTLVVDGGYLTNITPDLGGDVAVDNDPDR